jgi:octaprenyl-diphosphate synthase
VQAGGIAYAKSKMESYRDDALALLHEFPDSKIRQALVELVLYTTDREY